MCKQLMLALLMCGSVVGLVNAQNQGAEKSAKQIEREHMKAMASCNGLTGRDVCKHV